MKRALQVFFAIVLISMLLVTGWASSIEDVFTGGAKVLQLPWGIATLFDTYFAFLTFYVWVAYKESSNSSRLLWLAAILLLGNIAMAVYCLLQIRAAGPVFSMERVMLRAPRA